MSDGVTHIVGQRLNTYVKVKREEDSFDTSGPNLPILDYPPVKQLTLINVPLLHDRPLKKYFSHPALRVHLTKFKTTVKDERRRKQIKRTLARELRSSSERISLPSFDHSEHKTKRRVGSVTTRNKGFYGAYPILTMTPSSKVSRTESKRLLDNASRLLLSNERVSFTDETYLTTSTGTKLQALPNISTAKRKQKEKPMKRDSQSKSRQIKCYSDEPYVDSGRIRSGREVSFKNDEDDQYRANRTSEIYVPRLQPSPEPQEKADSWSRNDYADMSVQTDNSQKERNEFVSGEKEETEENSEKEETEENSEKEETEENSESAETRENSKKEETDEEKDETLEKETVEPLSLNREESQDDKTDFSSGEISPEIIPVKVDNYDQMSAPQTDENETTETLHLNEYEVSTETGDRPGASTIGPIVLCMYGDQGKTDVQLKNSQSSIIPFRRAQTDSFLISCQNVGHLQQIEIGHGSSQQGSAWYLESVSILDKSADRKYHFVCRQWISAQSTETNDMRLVSVTAVTMLDGTRLSVGSEQSDDDDGNGTSPSSSSSASDIADDDDVVYSENTPQESDAETLSDVDLIENVPDSKDEEVTEPANVKTEDVSDELRERDTEKRDQSPKPDNDRNQAYVITESEKETSLSEEETSDETDYLSEETSTDKMSFHTSKTPYNKTIHEAVGENNLNAVTELIEKDTKNIHARDVHDRTPLHLTCELGHVHILKYLSYAGANLEEETSSGLRGIHLAVEGGHINCLVALDTLGADLDPLSGDGRSTLHHAAQYGHLEVAKWLLANGVDLFGKDLLGKTAVDVAQEFYQKEMVKFLRERMRTGRGIQ